MLRTLRSRLLVVALAVELLVLLVPGWALQRQLTTSFTREVRVMAETIDKALGAALAPQLAQRDLAGLRDTVRDSAAEIGVTYLQLRSPRDGVVAASGRVPRAGQITGQLADAPVRRAAAGAAARARGRARRRDRAPPATARLRSARPAARPPAAPA